MKSDPIEISAKSLQRPRRKGQKTKDFVKMSLPSIGLFASTYTDFHETGHEYVNMRICPGIVVV